MSILIRSAEPLLLSTNGLEKNLFIQQSLLAGEGIQTKVCDTSFRLFNSPYCLQT